jgi:hypothetical protein
MRVSSFIFFVMSLLMSTAVFADAVERPIPADAKTGVLTATRHRQVMIDEKVRKLAAGAQIRNHRNLLIQPQTLVAQLARLSEDNEVPILYTENKQGQIHRIWILTRDEMDKYEADKESSTAPPIVVPNRSSRR